MSCCSEIAARPEILSTTILARMRLTPSCRAWQAKSDRPSQNSLYPPDEAGPEAGRQSRTQRPQLQPPGHRAARDENNMEMTYRRRGAAVRDGRNDHAGEFSFP